MKRIAPFAIPFLFASNVAAAGSIEGEEALALAALVADSSPVVSGADKAVLSRLRGDRSAGEIALDRKIRVEASAISCRMRRHRNEEFDCELTFGAEKVTVRRKKARDFYDDLPQETASGAFGEYFNELTALDCVVEPADAQKGAQARAKCSYEPTTAPLRK